MAVEAVYLYEKENAEAHRTFNFEMVHQDPAIPVLRRGQAFQMALKFNREYVDETDIVRLLFSFGPNPNVLRGTRGVNTVTSREAYLTDLEAWGVRMIGVHGDDLSIEVRSPVDSPVGVWQLNVETNTLGRKKAPNTYSYDKDIYLLFNPWLKGMPAQCRISKDTTGSVISQQYFLNRQSISIDVNIKGLRKRWIIKRLIINELFGIKKT